MHFKGGLYIYKGASMSKLHGNHLHRLNFLDLVVVENVSNFFIYVYTNKIGVNLLFPVYPYNLVPYEEFPEDDPVDTRSIAFWNKIRRNRLVFYKDLKTYG